MKRQTYMPAYFTPVLKKAEESESPIWAEAYTIPEGIAFTPEGAPPVGSQIPAEGSKEAWTPVAQMTDSRPGQRIPSEPGSEQLMRQTQALFTGELDESARLLEQTKALFNTPVWTKKHWER